MQNVPKIVRERLKATTPDLSASHPEADLLTAFAEHSLPGREKDLVIEHLARCGDCREIVALALPAMEAVEPVKTVALPARGWLTWPALRWGLVAAGVVAIASLGIVQYQRSNASRSMAEKSAGPIVVAANQPKQQPLETSQPAVAETQSDSVQSRQNSASGAAPVPVGNERKSESRARSSYQSLSVPQVTNGAPSQTYQQLPHGPRLANQWQQNNMVQNQVPASPPAPAAKQQVSNDQLAQIQAAPEVVEVESAAAQTDRQNKSLDAAKVQDLPSVRQPATEEYALARVGKAKPAAAPEYAAPGTTGGPMPSTTAGVTATSVSVPTWSISSSGGLQRSYDRGASWQVVDVNATPASFDALSVSKRATASPAKAKDLQSLKRDSASPIFRAVAANAADVWAGGSGGILFHSTDAGNHWTRVQPASAGGALTGDIVSVEFVDIQHGRVATSTAETWITSDAGQSWQRQ